MQNFFSKKDIPFQTATVCTVREHKNARPKGFPQTNVIKMCWSYLCTISAAKFALLNVIQNMTHECRAYYEGF